MAKMRLLTAFGFAPLIPAILLGLYTWLTKPLISPPMSVGRFLELGLTRVAYEVAFVLGIPLYRLLRNRLIDWWHFVLCGGALGTLPALVMDVLGFGGGGS
jgi:hypothetical protein